MIDVFLLCMIAVVASDCQTLHPPLTDFIPKDLLPEEPDNLIHPYPITYRYDFTLNIVTLRYDIYL